MKNEKQLLLLMILCLAFSTFSFEAKARVHSFQCEALFAQAPELQNLLKAWPESGVPKTSELALAERQTVGNTESIYLVGQLAIDPTQNSYKPVVVHLRIENQFGEFNKDGNLAELEILWGRERIATQLKQGDQLQFSSESIIESYQFKVNGQILEVKLFFVSAGSHTFRKSGERLRRGSHWKLVRANIQAI